MEPRRQSGSRTRKSHSKIPVVRTPAQTDASHNVAITSNASTSSDFRDIEDTSQSCSSFNNSAGSEPSTSSDIMELEAQSCTSWNDSIGSEASTISDIRTIERTEPPPPQTTVQEKSVPEQSADVITGYVHKISEVHTPTKGNVYFDFNLQLSPSKLVRGVCYSPEKRAKLKETQQKKIAVKIDNVQASIARRRASEQEYTVKKKSRITPSTVSFPYNETFSQTTFSISDINDISDFQAINVNAKVLSLGQQSTLKVRGKTLQKVDAIIADQTASIKLVLWENNFTLVENKTYAIKDVTVRIFSDSKYLTTTKYSTIIQIDDMEKTAPPTAQQYGKKISAKVVAVQVTHFQICPFCNTKIQSDSVTTDATKCSACSLTVLNTQLQNSTFSKFVIQEHDHDSFLNYIARESVVNTFLLSLNNATIDKFSEVELLKLLSSYSNLNFTLSEQDKLISEISLDH